MTFLEEEGTTRSKSRGAIDVRAALGVGGVWRYNPE